MKEQSHNDEYTCEDKHNSTFFNESIFGPIVAKNKQREVSWNTEFVAGTLPTEAKCTPVRTTTYDKRPSHPNMFERMMRNFEGNGEMAIKKTESEKDQEERGIEAEEKPIFRNVEWKNFITGVTKQVCYMLFL